MVDDFVFATLAYLTTANGNYSHQIAKCTGIASIIDDADLALLIGSEHLPHVFYAFAIGVDALITTTNTDTWRSLEEATVTTENLVLRITCEATEGRGAVYDRVVMSANVNDNERASKIHRTESNTWGGACSNAG
jgi:hypothetical protein